MEWLMILIILLFSITGLWLWYSLRQQKSLSINQSAPDFNLLDQHGKMHTLADFRGRWLVLYFYPRDDTPGCTKQACSFQDELQQLISQDAQVVGISVDSSDSHAGFARKFQLKFPLLADTTGQISERYHSLIHLGLIKFSRRNTFLIDPEGRIARIYQSVSTRHNAQEVTKDLQTLRRQQDYLSIQS